METYIILWVVLSLIVGYIGKQREGKFLPAFIASLVLSPLISLILTLLIKRKIPLKEKNEEELTKPDKIKNEYRSPYHTYIKLGAIIFIALLLTLPFHYIPSQFIVFPKENLTLSNTFIFQSDIDLLIERYNTANLFERASIINEPLFKKLKEKGLITIKEDR